MCFWPLHFFCSVVSRNTRYIMSETTPLYVFDLKVFTHNQIQIILDWYQKATSQHEKNIIVIFFKHVSEKHPKSLVDFFPQMCDDSIFEPATLNFRCNTIACIGQVHKVSVSCPVYMLLYERFSFSHFHSLI